MSPRPLLYIYNWQIGTFVHLVCVQFNSIFFFFFFFSCRSILLFGCTVIGVLITLCADEGGYGARQWQWLRGQDSSANTFYDSLFQNIHTHTHCPRRTTSTILDTAAAGYSTAPPLFSRILLLLNTSLAYVVLTLYPYLID